MPPFKYFWSLFKEVLLSVHYVICDYYPFECSWLITVKKRLNPEDFTFLWKKTDN